MTASLDPELVIATYNQGKIREVMGALRRLPLRCRSLSEFANISEVPELGQTYRENAVLKAVGYAKQTRRCALADDSGLEVDALDGRPGVFSARFGGESVADGDRINTLLAELSKQDSANTSARFVCCLALAGWHSTEGTDQGDEPQLLTVTEGRCEGVITAEPRGANGFGFDPIFVPTGYQLTFAQLSAEVKAKISHRARALFDMRAFINRWLASA